VHECVAGKRKTARPTASTFTVSATVMARTGGRAPPPKVSDTGRTVKQGRARARTRTCMVSRWIHNVMLKLPSRMKQRWEPPIGIQARV